MSARIDAEAPFPANVRAFTTLRHGAGASQAPFDTFNLGNFRAADGDDPGVVARNRAELVERFGLPSAPHWLHQVHGVEVVRVDALAGPPPRPSPVNGGGSTTLQRASASGEGSTTLQRASASGKGSTTLQRASASGKGSTTLQRASASGERSMSTEGFQSCPLSPPPPFTGEGWGGGEPQADAAVTSSPGVVLAILTADCLPVVFASKRGDEIAAAHAGWPGLSKGMLEATLVAMRTPAPDVLAWIGPAAGPSRYEVGRDVFDAFVTHDAGAAACFVPTREGHWLADLPALARRRLVAAGMSAGDIHGGDLCTLSDPQRFFSHRRDGRSGRIATIAWLA